MSKYSIGETIPYYTYQKGNRKEIKRGVVSLVDSNEDVGVFYKIKTNTKEYYDPIFRTELETPLE